MPDDLPTRPFGSVLTALVTPFAPDGSLDPAAAASLARHLVDAGCDGLVVSGTTGEAPTTSDAEKEILLHAVLEAVDGDARVVAGVGTNDTRHTVELAEQAAKAGAHGLLVVTPYYNKPPAAGLVAHFRTVADATDLPVMMYDIPGRTGTRLPADVIDRCAEHERIVAVKDATGDIAAGMEAIRRTGLAYYSGDDLPTLPWLAAGASGVVGVTAHLVPGAYRELVDAVDAGDLPRARDVALRIAPLARAVNTLSQQAIVAKAGLELLGRLPGRTTRPPLPPATEKEIAVLRTHLRSAGVLAGAEVAP